MVKKRKFVPTNEWCGNTMVRTRITHYIWTRSRGLWVYFETGLHWKSDYTLPELLAEKTVKEVAI